MSSSCPGTSDYKSNREEGSEYVPTNKFPFSITYGSLNHWSAALINIYSTPQRRFTNTDRSRASVGTKSPLLVQWPGSALYVQNINVRPGPEPMDSKWKDFCLYEWPWDQLIPCVCVLGVLQETKIIFRACTSTFCLILN